MTSRKWNVKTLEECKNELWSKTSRVKTLRDFGDLLSDLASTTFGTVFYLPLANKFNELYSQTYWRHKLLFVCGLALGFILGYIVKVI